MARYEELETIPATYRKVMLEGGDSGANGVCYLTSDGDVYKHFRMPFPYDYELGVLSEIESPSFAFPTCLVYLGKKDPVNLKGYRMDLVQGKKFAQLDPKTRIDLLLEAARKVEKDIVELAKNHAVVLYDVNNSNVIFQRDNTFRVIDTDLYMYQPSEEQYLNCMESMKEWNEYFLMNLKGGSLCFKSWALNEYHENALYQGDYPASYVTEKVIGEMRRNTGIDPVTLEEYYEGVQLLKKYL